MKKNIFFFLVTIFLSGHVFGQVDSIKYTPGFKFNDGIYKTYEEFKQNNPSIKGKATISKKDDVWGYCSNGTVYVLRYNSFHRLQKIGALIHYIESHEHLIYNSQSGARNVRTENIQHVIDFNTGNIIRFGLKNFLNLLKQDKDLYDVFIALKSKRQMKKKMFMYLIKFNDRNPIYFKTN